MKKFLSKDIALKIWALVLGTIAIYIVFSSFMPASISSYILPDFLVVKEPKSRYINSRGADPAIDAGFNIIISIILYIFSLKLIRDRFYGAIFVLVFSSYFTILSFSIIYYRIADGLIIEQKLLNHYDSFYLSLDAFFNSNISGIQIDKMLRPVAALEMFLGFLYLGTLISYIFLIYTTSLEGPNIADQSKFPSKKFTLRKRRWPPR